MNNADGTHPEQPEPELKDVRSRTLILNAKVKLNTILQVGLKIGEKVDEIDRRELEKVEMLLNLLWDAQSRL